MLTTNALIVLVIAGFIISAVLAVKLHFALIGERESNDLLEQRDLEVEKLVHNYTALSEEHAMLKIEAKNLKMLRNATESQSQRGKNLYKEVKERLLTLDYKRATVEWLMKQTSWDNYDAVAYVNNVIHDENLEWVASYKKYRVRES